MDGWSVLYPEEMRILTENNVNGHAFGVYWVIRHHAWNKPTGWWKSHPSIDRIIECLGWDNNETTQKRVKRAIKKLSEIKILTYKRGSKYNSLSNEYNLKVYRGARLRKDPKLNRTPQSPQTIGGTQQSSLGDMSGNQGDNTGKNKGTSESPQTLQVNLEKESISNENEESESVETERKKSLEDMTWYGKDIHWPLLSLCRAICDYSISLQSFNRSELRSLKTKLIQVQNSVPITTPLPRELKMALAIIASRS